MTVEKVSEMTSESGFTERSWARTRARRELLIKVGRKLATWRLLRVKNGHYYSPVPSMKELNRNAERIFDRSFRKLPGIEFNEADQLSLLTEFAAVYAEQPFPETPRDDIRYFFDNYWFGRADALFLYSMIRVFRPRRILEIGSGFSSAVMLDTNERFMNRCMRLTFVEPDSSRLRKLLKETDYDTVEIVEKPIQHVDMSVGDRLVANDILFVDSSHVSKAGSDVNHILFELLPRLAPGVLVHFHDVLYPFEYPKEWFELGISWNELYVLRAFLQYNCQFSIRFWNDFMMTFHRDEIRRLMPLCGQRPAFGVGGSLWLQKQSPVERTEFGLGAQHA
jgi:predicted O-methyltransferase YrrM